MNRSRSKLYWLVVELPVAPVERQQLVVRAALDDLAVLEHQDLVGAADRRQPVRDDERRPALPQRAQAVLDQRLALAVEARRRLVEDQDARVGEDRARDRDPLALAARELHAALADDGVVALLEPADELVAVRDAAGRLDLLPRRARAARRRCSRRPCRRTGSCPAARCRAGAVVAQPELARSRPSTRMAPACGRLNAITRLISVLLPEPLEPTSAVVVPAGARNETPLQHRDARDVGEAHVVELDLAADRARSAARLASSSSSVAIWRISRMRSSPAKASVICVPIDAIDTTGAATRPVKKMYITKSPSVIWPARIARPPTTIISTPMTPTMTVEAAATAETPIIDCATLRNSRWAPLANTSASRRSAV